MTETFFTFAIRTLDKPERLWRHAFESQISTADRAVLYGLVTLPGEAFLDDVFRALVALAPSDFLVESPGLTRSLKVLEGTFTRTSATPSGVTVALRNPSVRDFLVGNVTGDPSVARQLLERAVFFEQSEYLIRLAGSASAASGEFGHVAVDAGLPSLKRTFTAPSCRVQRVEVARRYPTVVRVPANLEARATFLIRVMNDSFDLAWWESALSLLAGRWAAHEGTLAGVVELMRALPLPAQSMSLPFLGVAKDWSFGSLVSAADFRAALLFCESAPAALVASGEVSDLRDRFRFYLEEELDQLWDYDDDEFIERVEDLGQAVRSFRIAEDERLVAARERVQELEESGQEPEPDPDDYERYKEEVSEREQEEEEIELMFASLMTE